MLSGRGLGHPGRTAKQKAFPERDGGFDCNLRLYITVIDRFEKKRKQQAVFRADTNHESGASVGAGLQTCARCR